MILRDSCSLFYQLLKVLNFLDMCHGPLNTLDFSNVLLTFENSLTTYKSYHRKLTFPIYWSITLLFSSACVCKLSAISTFDNYRIKVCIAICSKDFMNEYYNVYSSVSCYFIINQITECKCILD